MKTPHVKELWAAPELALAPPLLAALDATLAALRAQHATLDEEWLPSDPRSLHAARAFVAELARARAALLAYVRDTRRALRRHHAVVRAPLPF